MCLPLCKILYIKKEWPKRHTYLRTGHALFTEKIVKHQTMKKVGGIEIQLHALLTSASDGGDCQFLSQLLSPR
jgi:hypothetical protein